MASMICYDDVDTVQKTMINQRMKHVAVIGAGLVGSLAATMLGQRGFQVELFEYRSDIRDMEVVGGRSINLTLARRGADALERVGLKDIITQASVPVDGRMIHEVDGTYSLPYALGASKESTWSICRSEVNKILIDKADSFPNVKLHFEHKLSNIDLSRTEAEFQLPNGKSITRKFDAIISADGSFSKTRRQFLRETTFNFSQHFINARYMELSITPDASGNSKMGNRSVHIWPRKNCVFVGLPNINNSFAVCFIGPKEVYDTHFQTEEEVLEFFETYAPDLISFIGREQILKATLGSRGYPMVSIKCDPHVLNNTLLIGDAAHAMCPFYGEGMNCGFEDCLILDNLMDEFDGQLAPALGRYSKVRVADCQAMTDLALVNYEEIKEKVRSPVFRARMWLDNTLFKLAPDFWVPLYTSIRFQSKLGYSQCLANRVWQDQVVNRAMTSCGVVFSGILFYVLSSHLIF